MPFGVTEFLGTFARYNLALWPAPIALLLLGAALVALAMSVRERSVLVAAGLAVLWTWTALLYHVAFFVAINPAAWAFAALCLVEAAALAWYGVRRRTLRFDFAGDAAARWVGIVVVGYALVGYPVLGYALGHRYPAVPTFGLPCPTTIFTLGLLAWAKRPVPWLVVAPALLWAIVGTSAALQLGMREDLGLPAAGVMLVVLLARGRVASRHARPAR